MDLNQLKSGNGFVTLDSIQRRMSLRTPPEENQYILFLPGTGSFAAIGISCYDMDFVEICRIYTGNQQLYNYICDLFHQAAKNLEHKSSSSNWTERRSDLNHVDSESVP